MKISRYLDHAILKPDYTVEEVKKAIQLGIEYEVATVCVRPCDIGLAKQMCAGTSTGVSTVVDFPHGTGGAQAKEAQTALYADMGVDDIDVVMNHAYARSGEWGVVEDEIRRVVKLAHEKNVIVKVILETSQLKDDEIVRAVDVCVAAGADFVKSSTGFVGSGSKLHTVKVMLDAAKGRIKVKPAGGVHDFETAKMYLEMGVKRIGVGYYSTPDICGDLPGKSA